MIDSEPALASSTAAELAGAASAEDAGHGRQAPAAQNSPEGPPAQASIASAGTDSDAADETGSRAEAAQAGSIPRESGPHAATVSASNAPSVGSNAAAGPGLSCAGQASSFDADTGCEEAAGRPPGTTTACNPVAEHSTAYEALLDSDNCDATDVLGCKEQTSAAQSSPVMIRSASAAGTAALADSGRQPPSRKAGGQPVRIGSTQSQASSSTHTAHACQKQQAAHDDGTPDVAQV